jgi:hypothetical protein
MWYVQTDGAPRSVTTNGPVGLAGGSGPVVVPDVRVNVDSANGWDEPGGSKSTMNVLLWPHEMVAVNVA